jgi:hypothetical protein
MAAYAHANVAALQVALAALAKPVPDEAGCAAIIGDTPRRQALIQLLAYRMALLAMCYTTNPAEPALVDMIRRHQRSVASTQAELDPAPALPPPLAPRTGGQPQPQPHAKQQQGCGRCGHTSHQTCDCVANNHRDKSVLTSPKPGERNGKGKAPASTPSDFLAFPAPPPAPALPPPLAALKGIRFKQPTIIKCNRTKRNRAKCNLNKPRTITKWKNSVSLFLTSMYKAISTLTFSDDKQKAHILVRYFMDGLNPQSVPANLKLMMQTYLVDNPTSTVTDLYQHAEHILDTVTDLYQRGPAPCVYTSAVVALPALPAVTIGIRP